MCRRRIEPTRYIDLESDPAFGNRLRARASTCRTAACRTTTPPVCASSASAKPARPSPAGLRDTGIETIAAWDILFPAAEGAQLKQAGETHGRAGRKLGGRCRARRRHHRLRGHGGVEPRGRPLGRAASDRQSLFPRHQFGVARPQEGNREAARRQGALRRRRNPGADPSGPPSDAAAARRAACGRRSCRS